MHFERITAADLQPGDRFAYTRNQTTPYTVEEIESIGERSRWIKVTPGGRVRPRHTLKLWRVVEDAAA